MKKSRLVTIGIVLGALLGLGCLVGLSVWNMSGFAASAAKSPEQWKQWEANGLPTSKEQVVLAPPITERDSAQDFLQKAAALDRDGKRPPAPKMLFSSESWHSGDMKRYLAARQDVVAQLVFAGETKGLRLRMDWDRVSGTYFYHEETLFALADLLDDDAQLKAEADWRGAVRSIRAARRLAFAEAQIPSDRNVFNACYRDKSALFAAGYCASKFADNPEALRALRQTLEETRWKPDPMIMIRAGVYINLRDFRFYTDQQILDFARGNQEPWEPLRRRARPGPPASIMSRAVFAEIMAVWNEFYPQMLGPRADFDQIEMAMDARVQALANSSSTSQKIASQHIFVPSAGTLNSIKDQQAEQGLAIAFVRALEYRSLHHAWPPNLKSIGVTALDLIDGKPLRYRTSPTGLRIWSIGSDRRDDGGLSDWESLALKTRPRFYDHAYVHPWPPRP
jgi:hypothetical protein